MAISKWVLLFLVLSITAGLSGVANRSSVSADVAGALFDALLIILWSCLSWVLLSLDRRDPLSPVTLWGGVKASGAAKGRLGPLEPLPSFRRATIASWHFSDLRRCPT